MPGNSGKKRHYAAAAKRAKRMAQFRLQEGMRGYLLTCNREGRGVGGQYPGADRARSSR